MGQSSHTSAVRKTRRTQRKGVRRAAASQQTPAVNVAETLQRVQEAPQTATPADMLMLQRTLGNQAVQRMLNGQPRSTPHTIQRTEAGGGVGTGGAGTQRTGLNPETGAALASPENPVFMQQGNQLVPVTDGANALVQRAAAKGKKNPPNNIIVLQPAAAGVPQVQTASTGAKLGYAGLSFIAESIIGPLADLKHAIRVIHYKVQKDPQAAQKTKKVSDRVKDEWVGTYPGATWMNAIHGAAVTVEKAMGIIGAIAFLSTIISAWVPAAAPVAATCGVIAFALGLTDLVLRGILGIASVIKYRSATDAEEKKKFKKMAFGNLFGGIKAVIGLVTFGIGAGITGQNPFSGFQAQTPGAGDWGAFGVGKGGDLIGSTVGTVGDINTKRDGKIQREGEGKEGDSELLAEIDETVNDAEEANEDEKEDITQDKQDVSENRSSYGETTSELNKALGQAGETKGKADQAQSGLNSTEGQMEAPTKEQAKAAELADVQQLEEEASKGEAVADKEEVKESAPEPQKKGFFTRIKEGAKRIGKAIKKGAKAVFSRLSNLFTRFKGLVSKAIARLRQFVLHITGVDKQLLEAKQRMEESKSVEEQFAASLGERQSTSESIDAELTKVN